MEIHKREDYNLEFIQSLIDNEIEESINIDFKAGGALSKLDAKKKEISKDVSAFANSSGGIIVYGLAEKNHKADSFAFVDGNEFTKEWLEQIISSTIQRNIDGLKIFPIRNNGNISESIYVVQIPESYDAPHMCKDQRFYRRYNFESVAMEEYEVRNLYGRKSKSKLSIANYAIKYVRSDHDQLTFNITLAIMNIGDIEESKYKINTYFKNFLPADLKLSYDKDKTGQHYGYIQLGIDRVKIYNSGISTIYPNETIVVSKFDIVFSYRFLQESFDKMLISFKVFYSGGEDNFEIDFKTVEKQYLDAIGNPDSLIL